MAGQVLDAKIEQIGVDGVGSEVKGSPLSNLATEDEEHLLWHALQLELEVLSQLASPTSGCYLVKDKVVLTSKTREGAQPLKQILELRVLVAPTLREPYCSVIEAIWKAVLRAFSLSSW